MQAVSIAGLLEQSNAFDDALRRSHHLDAFCSSLEWIVPASSALMSPRSPWIFRGDRGFVAMMKGRHSSGFHWIEALEASWGLACPFVGSSTPEFAREILAHLESRTDWQLALVTGLMVEAEFTDELVQAFDRRYHIQLGEKTRRYIASLSEGLDPYLGRRSTNFRRSLRKAQNRARRLGVEFEVPGHGESSQTFKRILDVENRSWKGIRRIGIESGSMREFYRLMIPRLAASGRLRACFARRGDDDVGYLLGGVFGSTFRGLQCSYDAEHAGLGLGNLLQLDQMKRLIEEGVETYDLGTTAGHYKKRWSDESRDSLAVIIRR